MNLKKGTIFALLTFSIVALIMSTYNITVQSFSVTAYAQENKTGTTNEAEIEADIEQENKCKDDTDCENENEINNSLDITNSNDTGESQTTLNVIKTLNCVLENEQSNCGELVPEDFQITITGNNPSPSEFPGSDEGTLVTLGAGDYTVSESFELFGIAVSTTFSGDCSQSGEFEAQGNIEEGQAQTCTIENLVDLTNTGG